MTIHELKRKLRRHDARIKGQDARIAEQDALIAEQAARIIELERQVDELKKLLVEKANAKEAKPPKEAGNYSVARHEQKQRKRRRLNLRPANLTSLYTSRENRRVHSGLYRSNVAIATHTREPQKVAGPVQRANWNATWPSAIMGGVVARSVSEWRLNGKSRLTDC